MEKAIYLQKIRLTLIQSTLSSFLIFFVFVEKILTLDELQRRGWTLANKCFLCDIYEESIDHILLHCGKTKVLRQLLFSLFDVS